MKQRLPVLLLVLSALVLLGGCALEPTYRYQHTVDGGGYYSGQSPYGDADTVIYGNYYSAYPWGPWGGYYGPGWGGIGFGASYTFRHHRHHGDYRRWSHSRHDRHRQHASGERSSQRPANRPPPVKATDSGHPR